MLLSYSYFIFTFLDWVKAIWVHRAHRLLSESTRILCTLRNWPRARRTLGDLAGIGGILEPIVIRIRTALFRRATSLPLIQSTLPFGENSLVFVVRYRRCRLFYWLHLGLSITFDCDRRSNHQGNQTAQSERTVGRDSVCVSTRRRATSDRKRTIEVGRANGQDYRSDGSS